MNSLDSLKKVPTSKFRREMKKWLRYVEETNEPIIITHRSKESVVLVPMKYLEELVDTFS
jgi:prevent-host-death family protein